MKYLCLIILFFLSGCIESLCPESQTKIDAIQLESGPSRFDPEFMFYNDCCYVIRFAKNSNFSQPLDSVKMYRKISSTGMLLINNNNYTFDYDYLIKTNIGDYKVTNLELETKSCRTAWFRKANEYLQLKSYKVNGILQNYTYIMIYK
ncbi:MAG: hypothetical protein EAZ85_09000 [Bacteroidetes bacterium]|nr:MAG: hypothetical protein EAZ85_09000 [Bacteroidota bacterium]TAG88054.1 MAG: hypothetical protein EAZ20_09335 [Bacteroidota bacterium]